jgi:hypothetical protein
LVCACMFATKQFNMQDVVLQTRMAVPSSLAPKGMSNTCTLK